MNKIIEAKIAMMQIGDIINISYDSKGPGYKAKIFDMSDNFIYIDRDECMCAERIPKSEISYFNGELIIFNYYVKAKVEWEMIMKS